MNITIINQPINNRGDEAAHKSFVRKIIKSYPNIQIVVLFLGTDIKSIDEINVHHPNVSYICINEGRGTIKLMKFAVRYHMEMFIMKVIPCLNAYFFIIKNADIIISAPGGICLGGFQNWHHLLILQFTRKLKKKIIYYSRSIGPFPERTKSNKVFKKYSLQLLKYFTFISIRDSKSMELMHELKIPFYPAIDTAFLDTPNISIPPEILHNIGFDYIVFVPNSLTWHPFFNNIPQTKIDNFYVNIFSLLLERYRTSKIILLPQLYLDKNKSDFDYFLKLSELINRESVVCLHETISSDIQQQIIAKSKLVIGSRYHSIVFAINNNVPFISLSYEHKMSGLLDLLSLSYRQINLLSICEKEFNENQIIKELKELLNSNYKSEEPKFLAKQMALNCFNQMIKVINNG